MKILGTSKNSKCMYCRSEAYGRGCIYSPNKNHVHVDDPKRCIYCGSTASGTGCPFNPFSKVHVHGIEFNTMTTESLHKHVVASILINRLFDDTISESTELVDRYVSKIKAMIGEQKLEFVNDLQLLESKSNSTQPKNQTLENITLNTQFEYQSKKLIKEMYDLIKHFNNENVDIDNILFQNLLSVINQ